MIAGKRYRLTRKSPDKDGIFVYIGPNPIDAKRLLIVWEKWQIGEVAALDGSPDNLWIENLPGDAHIFLVENYQCPHCHHLAEGLEHE